MEKIIRYAHVAEIVDRIIIESLKVSEFLNKSQLFVGEDTEMVNRASQHAVHLAEIAQKTAIEQEEVLRERLSSYHNGEFIAELLIAVIKSAISTATVARFENLKRQEHMKNDQRDLVKIANWDNLSRDACEARANAKATINEFLSKLIPDYDYPWEARTF